MNKSFHFIFIMVAIMLLALGFAIGFTFGMNRMQDIVKEVDCKNDFYDKSLKNIRADCIKYLK